MFKITRSATAHLALPIALLTLAGCQSPPIVKVAQAAPTPQQAFESFIAEFQSVVKPHMLAANADAAVGAQNLRVMFNRNNEILSCHAEPAKAAPAFPPTVLAPEQRRDDDKIAHLINQQCKKILYPIVPEHLFGEEGTVDIVAPLIFLPLDPLAVESQNARVLRQAQSDYFWQQLMVDQPVDSVGRATFWVGANALGEVQSCLVSLSPVHVRRDAFKRDHALQAQLTKRCMTLDLRKMPGFALALDDQWRANGAVTVEYAPWKVGLE